MSHLYQKTKSTSEIYASVPKVNRQHLQEGSRSSSQRCSTGVQWLSPRKEHCPLPLCTSGSFSSKYNYLAHDYAWHYTKCFIYKDLDQISQCQYASLSHWTPLCPIKSHHLMPSTVMCSLQMLSLVGRQRLPEDSSKSMYSLFQVNFQHGKWGERANNVPFSFIVYSVQLRCSEGTRWPTVTSLGLPSLCTIDNPMAQRQGAQSQLLFSILLAPTLCPQQGMICTRTSVLPTCAPFPRMQSKETTYSGKTTL